MDKPVLTRKIDQATSLNPPDLVLDESKLQPGVNHIRVSRLRERAAVLFDARRVFLGRYATGKEPARRRSTYCAIISG